MKTNVGHGEAVSGLSGIIKTVLALEKGRIPPTIGVNRINPKIRTKEWGVKIVTKSQDWPADRPGSIFSGVRRAGVNSFGYGGANGHVILEAVHPSSALLQKALFSRLSDSSDISSAESSDQSLSTQTSSRGSSPGPDVSLRNTFLLPFSATSSTALEARVSALQGPRTQTMDIVDLAYTLGCRRTDFSERGYVVAKRATLHDDLSAENLRNLPNVKSDGSPSDLGFVFTGQGAQWTGMGKELFEEFFVFRHSIREMDAVLRTIPHPPEWTIEGTLFESAETSNINTASCAQPMATALQIATVELLRSWNVHPRRVVGHSSGEVAAAFAAGHISTQEAITAAYYRGYVNGANKRSGAMMAVGLGSDDAEAEITQAALRGKVGIACVNSPVSVTMSGDTDAINTLSTKFQSRGVFARKLNTGGKAYHSYHMAVLGPELEKLLPLAVKGLPHSNCISTDAEFISSVTGEPKSTGFDATYWRTNMESPVLFSQAVQYLIRQGDVHLVEIGPHSALELPLKQIKKEMKLTEDRIPYSCSLSRGQNAAECILNLMGRLFCHGQPLDFHTINTQDVTVSPRVLTDLPPYPRTYDGILWSESRLSREVRYRKDRHHELLGSQVPGGDGLTRSWRNILRVEHVSWLKSHKLEETVIFPGAGYIAMVIEAVSQILGVPRINNNTFSFRHVNILAALVLMEDTEAEIFTSMRPKPLSSATTSKEWWDFEIVSYTDGYSSLHANGSISLQMTSIWGQAMGLSPANGSRMEKVAPKAWYNKLAEAGLNFGPDFQSIKEIQKDSLKASRYAETMIPFLQDHGKPSEYEPAYVIHPITIDALLQSGIIAASDSLHNVQAKMPVSIESAIFGGGKVAEMREGLHSVHAAASVVGFGAIEIVAELQDSNGHVSAQLRKVRMAPYTPAARQESSPRQPMLRVVWKPDIYGNCWTDDSFLKQIDALNPTSGSIPSASSETRVIFAHILSLFSHKIPKLRVLELSDKDAEISRMVLDGGDLSHTIRTLTAGYLSASGQLFGTEVEMQSTSAQISRSATEIRDQTYDLIVLPNVVSADLYLHAMLSDLKGLLAENGSFLATTPCSQKYSFVQNGFSETHKDLSESRITLAAVMPLTDCNERVSIIVERDDAGESAQQLTQNLLGLLDRSAAISMKFSEISKETVPFGAIIYSLLEAERPLLSSLADDDMTRLKLLTDRASKIAWATAGSFLSQARPDFALASGLARAIMIEQPSLAFCTLDIEQGEIGSTQTALNLYWTLHQPRAAPTDYEFIQSSGLIWVSRFVPDESLNQAFRRRQGNETMFMSLAEAKPSSLTMTTAGQFDTIEFKKQTSTPGSSGLQPGLVEVEVQAIGLNAKGVQVFTGKNDRQGGACTLEYCGLITRTAPGGSSTGLLPGDHVVVMAPGHMNTHEIAPEWACSKLKDGEKPQVVATVPVVFSNAVFALHHRARIQPGETVLIHSGADEVGNAAIQIAKMAGVEIYTTVSTDIQRNFLISKFGLKRENVLNKDDTFYRAIMEATHGKGVDVVLNSLSGELLHASWNACASFGRFIELGTKDIGDSGKLDMHVFKRGATFSALDLGRLFYDDHPAAKDIWAK